MGFEDYGKWFLDTIQCNNDSCKKFCKLDNGEREQKKILCNYNMSNYKINISDSPVRPQAGYIDANWFDKENRILLLGLNPRGGYERDNGLYEVYDQIITTERLTIEQMSSIQKQVDDYWVLTLLKTEIEKMYPPVTAFAYTNQILCRTKPEANKINVRDGIEEVYKICFESRVFELIKITNPTKIIAVGQKWQKYFLANMNEKMFPPDKFICACHPTYGRKKKTLAQIKSCLEKGNNI